MVWPVQNHAADPFGVVGQVLDGQFRVDRLVGEGGFSAVYRGFHVGLQEPVAVKCLKLPPSLSPPVVDQFAKRFRDESRILYRLSQGNLNVVRSIAAGTWQMNTGLVVPYMILEWLEGRSLANEFTIRRTVGHVGRPLDEVVQLFASAADGLGYAHSQGVVHRDVNPGNLFCQATPQGIRMKVLDFGVAKILDESTLNIARMHTMGQIRIFAPAYGAPEQFDESIGQVGPASDVYAFALILLEALRDRTVNDGTHLGEFAQLAIDPNRRPTPRLFGIDVPDEVEHIFARATALHPRERWQNASEFWSALVMATSAATQQRHARAADETPSLGMPASLRNKTQAGVAPPGAGGTLPPPAPPPGVSAPPKRNDRTLPLGTAFPKLDVPSRGEPPLPSFPLEEGLPPGLPEGPLPERRGHQGTLMMAPRAPAPVPAPLPAPTAPRGPLTSTMPLTGTLPSFGQNAGPPPAAAPAAPPSVPVSAPHAAPPSWETPSHVPPVQVSHAATAPELATTRASLQSPAPKKRSVVPFAVVGGLLLAAFGGAMVYAAQALNHRPVPPSTPSAVTPSASTAAAPVETVSPAITPTASATEIEPEPKAAAVPSAAASTRPEATPVAEREVTPPVVPAATRTAAPVVKDAGPPPDPNAFNEAGARSALSQANGVLVFCKKTGGVTGPGSASITFNSDGSVGSVTVDPPYTGTPTGDCVAGQFKRAKAPAFQGPSRTLKHTFEVP